MVNKLKFISFLAVVVLFIISCNNEEQRLKEPDVSVSKEPTEKERERFQRAKIVLFALPSPVETAKILKLSGAFYDKSFLNPIVNQRSYVTSSQKALGLGIYIADLSYANAFKQQQDCLEYFSVIQKISEELGLIKIFSPDFIEKVTENIGNQDSILKYASNAYWRANEQLKEDEREGLAGLLAAGAWIEGFHISCALVNPNDEITKCIAEQLSPLKQLIKYIESFDDPKTLGKTIDDLKAIEKVLKKVEVKINRKTSSVNEEGIAIVGSKKEYIFPPKVLQEIVDTLNKIRSTYI